jgi:hypothetical protein
MSTLIIEHLKASELPPQWAQRLKVKPEQTVTVRIETETEQTGIETTEAFVTDDPAFGIWRDRKDVADVDAYLHKVRTPRYNRDGSRNEG